MKTKRSLHVMLALVLLPLSGCVSPGDFDEGVITRYQEAMVKRSPQPRVSDKGLGLLEPCPGVTGPKLKVQTDPSGKSAIYLSLDEAIMRALANSLDVQVVSFDPEITRQQAIEAAAVFDYVFFGGVAWDKSDLPLAPGSVNTSQIRTTQYQVGIKQQTVTGATWQIAPTLTHTNAQGIAGSDLYLSQLNMQVTQPLLRNAWPEFNLAKLHIAQLSYKNSVSTFRQTVEQTLNSVISTYWTLMQARYNLDIQKELLKKTIETRDRIKERMKIDATLVELKQAEAAVETRRAVLYRVQKTIYDAQDQLARLLADAQINALTKYEIIPTTDPAKTQVKIDAADQLVLGLLYNPQLEQARIAIAAADINVKVAFNQTLPRLDLQASTILSGQDPRAGESIDNLGTFNFIGYNLSLLLEYPIGNRSAIAELNVQKYNRLKAITMMQNTADQLAVAINERIRQVNTTFQEMQAQKAAVEASAAQLQALQYTENIRGKLTPEFLQVKLQAQQQLADSQAAEVQAIVNYNSALADLARFTGTILRQHGIEMEKVPAVTGEKPWPQYKTSSSAPTLVPMNPAGPEPTTLFAPGSPQTQSLENPAAIP